MSISTTYFVNTTVAADNAAEVYTWLQKYASEYFDSFAISEDGLTISCFIGALEAAQIYGFGGYCYLKVFLPNGATSTFKSGSAEAFITKAVKTSGGIVLLCDDKSKSPFVFFTKSASGDTAIVFASASSVSSSQKIYAVIPPKEAEFKSFYVHYDVATNDYTSLAPIVCPGGTGYLPQIFRAVYNQYQSTEGIITLCGKQYYTNGYLMLAL